MDIKYVLSSCTSYLNENDVASCFESPFQVNSDTLHLTEICDCLKQTRVVIYHNNLFVIAECFNKVELAVYLYALSNHFLKYFEIVDIGVEAKVARRSVETENCWSWLPVFEI